MLGNFLIKETNRTGIDLFGSHQVLGTVVIDRSHLPYHHWRLQQSPAVNLAGTRPERERLLKNLPVVRHTLNSGPPKMSAPALSVFAEFVFAQSVFARFSTVEIDPSIRKDINSMNFFTKIRVHLANHICNKLPLYGGIHGKR